MKTESSSNKFGIDNFKNKMEDTKNSAKTVTKKSFQPEFWKEF